MRGARRLTMACLAAGLMLGSASASAQDAATTTNTPAAQAVGPRELENFSLQGNVTRAAEEPAQRPSPAPVASTPDDQPAPAATVRQPRERTASAEPATTSPRSAPSPQGEPARKTAKAASQPTTKPSDGLLTQATPTPASATSFAPPPLAATSTLAPQRGFALLPWLLAALAAAAAGLFLFWRNRSRPALAGGPRADAFQAPEAKPIRWLTPEELEPKPMPRPAPSPTPEPPAPPRAETPAPQPIGVVSTSLRPWVEISMQPLRCTVTDANVTFEFELELFNSGSAPARDVAGRSGGGQRRRRSRIEDLRQLLRPTAGPGASASGSSRRSSAHRLSYTQVVIAREQSDAFDMGGREGVRAADRVQRALSRGSSGEGQTSASYLRRRATEEARSWRRSGSISARACSTVWPRAAAGRRSEVA